MSSGRVALFARFVGFDRDRAFYPTVLMVIASYYVLFAAMSDSVRGYWVYRRNPEGQSTIATNAGELPLTLSRGDDPTRADLFFSPVRDESDRMMTLRLILSDGALAVVIVVEQRFIELLAIQQIEAECGLIEHEQVSVDGHDQREMQLRHHALG